MGQDGIQLGFQVPGLRQRLSAMLLVAYLYTSRFSLAPKKSGQTEETEDLLKALEERRSSGHGRIVYANDTPCELALQ